MYKLSDLIEKKVRIRDAGQYDCLYMHRSPASPPYHHPELRAHCSRYRDNKPSSRTRTSSKLHRILAGTTQPARKKSVD